MTNQELLEIIKLAREYKVQVNTLTTLLKLAERDGEIREAQVARIKMLLKEPDINDSALLLILKKSDQRKKMNWKYIVQLKEHPQIKNTLASQNHSQKEWEIILEQVSTFPVSERVDMIYLKWLNELYKEPVEIEELKFYHKVLKACMNTKLLYQDWYFNKLLDRRKLLKEREGIFLILKQNLLNLLSQNGFIEYETEKGQKMVECYELYGKKLASLYGTVITCVIDLEIPEITSEAEYDLYLSLYKTMCLVCADELVASNFIQSDYYEIATKEEIEAQRRLEFIMNLNEKSLVLKNRLVAKLWEAYNTGGLEKMKRLKYAFLNHGIRTNPLCREFLMQEESLRVLEVATTTLKKNRVRKDTDGLHTLCTLEKSADKIKALQFLESKYPDETEEKRLKEERKKQERETLEKAYQDFFDKKIGLAKLEKTLEATEGLKVELVRARKK